MWDIHWTDPNRQLVGEHRAQKHAQRARKDSSSTPESATASAPTSPSSPNREGAKKSKKKGKQMQKRNSLSTRSSLSSADSPFAFFRNGFGSKANRDTKLSACSSGVGGNFAHRKSIGSDYASARNSRAGFGDEGGKLYMDEQIVGKQNDISSELSCQDSVFSKDAHSDQDTLPSLGQGSPTEKKPTLTVRHPSGPSVMSGALMGFEDDSHRDIMTQPNTPIPTPLPTATTPSRPASVPESAKINPQLLQFPVAMQSLTSFSRIHEASVWKTPEEWTSSLDKNPPKTETSDGCPKLCEQEEIMSIDHIRDEIATMDIMTPANVLQRLGELFSGSDNTKMMEAEEQMWMFWALTIDEKDMCRYSSSYHKNESLLALYESPIRTSYLAAINPSLQIHHLSSTPLSHSYSPFITPIETASLSPFPPLPQLFDHIVTTLLPSLLPRSSLLETLYSLSASLEAKGTLHLTLINPAPRPSTAGPLMTAWLETHLFSPLRQNDMCTTPTRIFPKWLGEAGLRGQGSSLTTTKFFAAPPLSDSPLSNGCGRGRSDERLIIKAHIRSLTGRMLWWSVWGRWVKVSDGRAKLGWWDDLSVMEECAELGTIWEYQVIEAVKNSQV